MLKVVLINEGEPNSKLSKMFTGKNLRMRKKSLKIDDLIKIDACAAAKHKII